ncbi:hypothetical protein Xets_01934 [Xenorhabdus sp. TS4]|nr:hypothetical protein [Xenorhabdus sp. TS4]
MKKTKNKGEISTMILNKILGIIKYGNLSTLLRQQLSSVL